MRGRRGGKGRREKGERRGEKKGRIGYVRECQTNKDFMCYVSS